MFAGIRDGGLMPRPLALAMLGAALLLRVLIPTGWMPVSGPDGIRIVLCTPSAMAKAAPEASQGTAHGDHRQHDPKKHEKPAADQPCAFSGLAMAANVLPPLGAMPPLCLAGETVRPWPAGVTIGRELAAPPPPSTGPPVFA
jgi:hypothetical protein